MPLAADASNGTARQRDDSPVALSCASIGYSGVTPSRTAPTSAIIGHLKITLSNGTNHLQEDQPLASI